MSSRLFVPNRKQRWAIASVAMLAMSGSTLWAQQNDTVQETERSRRANASATETRTSDQRQETSTIADEVPLDRRQNQSQAPTKDVQEFLAAKLVLCNNMQIEAAKMIQEQTESEEVKGFARRLLQGHQEFNGMLEEFAAPYSVHPAKPQWDAEQAQENATDRNVQQQGQLEVRRQQAARLASGTEVTDVTNPDRLQQDTEARQVVRKVAPGQIDPSPLADLYQIATKAASKRQQACRDMLSQYEEGYNRDMAFVGLQMAAHQGMLAELQAIEPAAKGPMQEVVRKGITMVEGHLQIARELTRNLELQHQHQTGAAQRPSTPGNDRSSEPSQTDRTQRDDN